MTIDAWLTLLTIVACFIGLMSSRFQPELILIAGVVFLLMLDVIAVPQVLAGFANEGMATVAVLYIVAAGLTHSGAVSWLSQTLLGKPQTTTVAQYRVMLPVALMSSVLNNTPVVAMLIPAISDWAKRYNLSVSQLMIPLSYAAIIGGCCTVVGTSTNLVVNGMLKEVSPGLGLELFDLAWIGVPLVIATVVYILVFSRWLLPNRFGVSKRFEDTRQYMVEMVVEPYSALAGQTIEEAGLRRLPGVFLVEVQRNGRFLPAVSPTEVLYANDQLLFAGNVESVVDLKKIHGLRSAEEQAFKIDSNQQDRCLVEAVIGPRFPEVGKTVRDGRFRSNYGAAIIAIAREGERIQQRIGDIELRAGDTLLLEAHREFVDRQKYAKDFLLVSKIENSQPVRHERRFLALSLLVGMVALVSGGFMSMFEAAMLVAGAMVLTGCVSLEEAKESIKWDVLLVIAASIALGLAMDKSGAANWMAQQMIGIAGSSPWATITILFCLTAGFSAIISNLAAAVLLFPVALASSVQLDISVTPLAVTLMIGASASFATPIGYQTNLMVYGPGDYRFMDFVRFGTPLTFLIGFITVLLVPVIWPFY